MVENLSGNSFGERVKELIRMVGSAERLARLSGMSGRAIGQYAAGTSEPTRSKIVALAAATGVNILWIMTGEGPKIKRKLEVAIATSSEVQDIGPIEEVVKPMPGVRNRSGMHTGLPE